MKLALGTSLRLSDEWMEGTVGYYDSTKALQQKSLRKKIYEHRDSVSHAMAVKLLETRKEELLKTSLDVQLAEQHAETCNVFRTAYYVAKNDRPYTDHPD